MIVISTVLWIIGCEILWHGTLWIENIYELVNLHPITIFQFIYVCIHFLEKSVLYL